MTTDYGIDFERGRVGAPVTGETRTLQNLHKRLLTEQGRYALYPADYGMETGDLIGRDRGYALPEFCRRVRVCCLRDPEVECCTVTAGAAGDTLTAAVTVQTVYSTNPSEVTVHV